MYNICINNNRHGSIYYITIGFKVDFFSISHIFVKHMSGNPDVRETEERDLII